MRTNLKYYCDNKNFKERRESSTEEGDLVTTGTYMKKKRIFKRWTRDEEEKFYKALSVCGCDFSLMEMIFKGRDRKNLKDKYLREVRYNKMKVERALRKHKEINKEKLKELMEM